jgi:hypothetical protein
MKLHETAKSILINEAKGDLSAPKKVKPIIANNNELTKFYNQLDKSKLMKHLKSLSDFVAFKVESDYPYQGGLAIEIRNSDDGEKSKNFKIDSTPTLGKFDISVDDEKNNDSDLTMDEVIKELKIWVDSI